MIKLGDENLLLLKLCFFWGDTARCFFIVNKWEGRVDSPLATAVNRFSGLSSVSQLKQHCFFSSLTPFQFSSRILKTLLLLPPGTQRHNQMTDITHGQLQWEIDRIQHLRKENPPTSHDGQETERSCRDLQFVRQELVPRCQGPVGARQDDEGQ